MRSSLDPRIAVSRAISRRLFLAVGLGLPAVMRGAVAKETYPARPIKIVIGYSSGGLSDTMTRLIAEHMARDLGQPVVVENRVGASASIASAFVARSTPDGYTLLMGTTSLAINPVLHPNLLPRDPQKELLPLGMVYDSPFVLIVRASLPIRNLDKFIAYGRENPGALEMGSSGAGAVNHLLIEMLSRKAGIDIVPIPYTGAAPTVIDLRGGRIAATFATPIDAMPLIQDGTVIPLAVSSPSRVSILPDIPAVAEKIPGVYGTYWQGLFAPVGTPDAVAQVLSAALERATRDPEIIRRAAERGVIMQTGNASAMRERLATETAHWSDLIKTANIKPQ